MGALLFWPFLWAGCAPGCESGAEAGFLHQPAYCIDDCLRGPVEPYLPQPGDIVLMTDRKLIWKVGFNLALTGHPHHVGIVVACPDGDFAVIEAGPNEKLRRVEMMKLGPHLAACEATGPIWVRRRRLPLTDEESDRLTAFALAQDGKRFALGRLLAQLTVFRNRGPLRTEVLGKPHGERRSYFCSELVLEACLAAGLLDPSTARPAATYPRDIFFDRSPNPVIDKGIDLSACWHPPARWTSGDCGWTQAEK